MDSGLRVENLIDNTYQVVRYPIITNDGVTSTAASQCEPPEVLHQGSLADCEAYIRLKEGGYM